VTATGGGKTLAQVFVGSASGDTAVHMRDASRPLVFTVEKSLADDLQRAAAVYRSKDLFAFRMFNLSRLVLTRGDTTRTFEKKKTGTGADATETWAQTSPAAPAISSGTIDDLASRLSTLRAEAWEPAPTNATSVLTAVATFDGTREERVSIVEAGGQMYALRDGEQGAARLTAPAVTDLLALLEPAPAAPSAGAPAAGAPATPVTRP
jgi:hypothetical protein